MFSNFRSKFSVLAFLALSMTFTATASATAPPKKDARPNWKVTATGESTVYSIDLVNFTRIDTDKFYGTSSHLGKYTASGEHTLHLLTGEFAGIATYTAANGDTLDVVYAGQLFPSGDANFPYGAEATVVIVGGTGRFAGATGGGVLTGGFTGETPVGAFFFDVAGTLKTKRKERD